MRRKGGGQSEVAVKRIKNIRNTRRWCKSGADVSRWNGKLKLPQEYLTGIWKIGKSEAQDWTSA